MYCTGLPATCDEGAGAVAAVPVVVPVLVPDAVVLGLTATPPASLSRAQAELVDDLFGPVLHEARIPALVKDGVLAPYAELAWVVPPTTEESAWLDEQSTRFAELVGVPPSVYRRDAARSAAGTSTEGIPACVAGRVTRPIRNREAPLGERS